MSPGSEASARSHSSWPPTAPVVALVALTLAPEARASDGLQANLVLAIFVLAPTVAVFFIARRLLSLPWHLLPVLATALLAWSFWLNVPDFLDSIGSVFAGGFGLPLALGLLLVWLLVRWRARRSARAAVPQRSTSANSGAP